MLIPAQNPAVKRGDLSSYVVKSGYDNCFCGYFRYCASTGGRLIAFDWIAASISLRKGSYHLTHSS